MKFITYFLLAVAGVILGVGAYLLISPLLPTEEVTAPATEELIGGKTKEQIASEFLASLEEEEASQDQRVTVAKGQFSFLPGSLSYEEQDAGGVSYIAFRTDATETPIAELYILTGEDLTYERMIDDALFERVTQEFCGDSATEQEVRTCFNLALNDRLCETGEYGELILECYNDMPLEAGNRSVLFGQTVDFLYYFVVNDMTNSEVIRLLESVDLYPEE